MRRRWLRDLVWPPTDQALARPRDAAVVVATVFRTVTGRRPTPGERAELVRRVRSGWDFEALVEHLEATPEGLHHASERAPRLARQFLEQEILAEGGPAAAAAAPVLHLHIMKTAGTSMSELLKQWAGPGRSRVAIPLDDLAVLPPPLLARLRAVSGHIPYEAVTILPGPFQTVTVLREPVGRTLSHYRELRRRQKAARDLSLDEFLHSDVYDAPSGNYQARSLAHTIDLAGAWVSYSPLQSYLAAGGDPGQPYPLQSLFDSTPILMSDEELLKRASRNLASIDLVGVTEDLDSLAARVASLFGVQQVTVPILNASEPSDRADLPARTRRLIEQRTEVDRELYEQAVRLARA